LLLFYTVPRSCVYDLWEAFNDIAEGFGLTIEEFQEILKCALLEYLGVTERVLNTDTDKVFRIFDDDEVSNIYYIFSLILPHDLILLNIKLSRIIWSTLLNFYPVLHFCRA
jgi:hypothetical protein